MNPENKKYWILVFLIALVLWWFWEKVAAMVKAAETTASTGSGSASSGTAATAPALAQAASKVANSDQSKVNLKFYPYGAGGFVEDTSLLNFTAKTGNRSAFK